jgi:pyruvate,orthophosphate dikinase
MTSHAAVIARGWGKPCVVGCSDVQVNELEKYFSCGTKLIHEGDWISLNGTSGEVILGRLLLKPATISGDLNQVLKWTNKCKRLGVRANIDTVSDACVANMFGAEGIGLVRTERMFFKESRITHMVRYV